MTFEGELRPLPYAALAWMAFLSQYVISGIWNVVESGSIPQGWRYLLVPLTTVATGGGIRSSVLIGAIAVSLLLGWIQAALAFRRLADARRPGWLALFAVLPPIQLIVLLGLSFAPTRSDFSLEQRASAELRLMTRAAIQGALIGTVLIVLAVTFGALILKSYGVTLFAVLPVVVGATTAFIANRDTDIGRYRTLSTALLAATFGSLALIVFALEGLVCLILAAPIGVLGVIIGAELARRLALRLKRASRGTAASFVILPLAMFADYALPTHASFETAHAIEIGAPAERVWDAIVEMQPITEEPGLAFRLGVAYPIGADLEGTQIGAVRRGMFSTGDAKEVITGWVPNRRLAFRIEDDVPSMHELSLFENVHAPHVRGYFLTRTTVFEIAGLTEGHSRLTIRSTHELRLGPAQYWTLVARWIVAENDGRVLSHIRRQAESP